MISANNTAVLKRFFPDVLKFYDHHQDDLQLDQIQLLETRNGSLTLAVVKEDKRHFLHSQYNPQDEAERLVNSYDNVESYQHILFWGIGLGHHINMFLERFPNMNFSVFEPDLTVFYRFLECTDITNYPIAQWKNIYVSQEYVHQYMNHFMTRLYDKVLIVVPPSYERAYPDQLNEFYDAFKRHMEHARTGMYTNLGYERLWVINSFKNFPKVLATPSMIREKKIYFEQKPVIIAAAGPSLQDEFENLKRVKLEKRAFIVAVGSANKALLAAGIVPDLVATYDPNFYNSNVFSEIIESGRSDIPMIFGSSVGYPTLEKYNGPLLHMITSQDPVATFFLGKKKLIEANEIVLDAPSIAVLTLQLMAELGANPIILAGQNFGFRKDQYYATGIEYKTRPTFLTEEDRKAFISVKSTDGGMVDTTESHNSARLQMQAIISNYSYVTKIINTTKGGASIEGTTFIPFEDLMVDSLENHDIFKPDWYEGSATEYDKHLLNKQQKKLEKIKEDFIKRMDLLVSAIKKMERLSQNAQRSEMEKTITKFDLLVNKFMENEYFCVFIQPLVRVEHELLSRTSKKIQDEIDVIEKGKLAVNQFGRFIYECQQMHILVSALMEEMLGRITTTS